MPYIHITTSGRGSPVWDWYRHELGWEPCPTPLTAEGLHGEACLRQYILPDKGQKEADEMQKVVRAQLKARRGRKRG